MQCPMTSFDCITCEDKCMLQERRQQETPKRYRMLKDSDLEPAATAGAIVYRFAHHDYSMAAHDEHMTGVPHISVTLNSDGSYPFFTVAERDVEEV